MSKRPTAGARPRTSRAPTKPDRRVLARQALREELERRRRSRIRWTAAGLAAILGVAGVIVVSGLHWANGSGVPPSPAPAALVNALSDIPASSFDAVGRGSITTGPVPVTGRPLTADGKPRVLYVGAEFCPYCGAERWAIVAALSRFGSFSGLEETTSARADVFPDTPTLSFHGATYRSKYLTFTGYETLSNQVQGSTYAPLETLSDADQTVLDTYDRPPHLKDAGRIPFIDFGNTYVTQGANYSPGLLQGMSHAQVAAAIADGSTAVSQAVLGTANTFTAVLCRLTDDRPARVCSSTGVTAAAANLGGS